MSNSYDVAELSMAYNDGHNDGWAGEKPRPAPHGITADQKHQRYQEGHAAGMSARYWYDEGLKEGMNQ